MNTSDTFRDIAGLTRFLKVLLGLGVVVAAVSLLSSFMQAELLSRGSFSEAEGQANDSREAIIGILYLLLYLLTAVVFGRWIVSANKNVRALGADGLRISPGLGSSIKQGVSDCRDECHAQEGLRARRH